MKTRLILGICAALVLTGFTAVTAQDEPKVDKARNKRAAIDYMASETIDRLLSESPQAKQLFDQSAGYAVFDSIKVAVLLSGGGGVGVAIDRTSGERTYMKMGTAGIGLGLGGQSYQIVFLFENERVLRQFVAKGWQADAAANAVAGTSGTNLDANFTHGVAVFQITNKGLMALADISGTKYWKHKKLNR